jgi:cytochrome c oxidase subunit 2
MRVAFARSSRSALAAALLLCGCDGPQSILNPAGETASDIARLSWFLFAGAAALLLLVVALAAAAFVRGRRMGTRGGERLILLGGVALPVAVLTVLIVHVALLGHGLMAGGGGDVLRVHVVGKQWWWRVQYLDAGGGVAFETANELHVPVGRPVHLSVTSDDVIHSFWIPALAGKIDMLAGRTNHLHLKADRPAVLRGQCAEHCGLQHTWMALDVVAEPAADFARWHERQAAPAPEPATASLREGRDLFIAAGCGTCHAVRGTGAEGTTGPDLTHVGGRRSLAAGRLPNNVGTLAGWIVDSQGLKPGNLMPSFHRFESGELRKLAGWLESLE